MFDLVKLNEDRAKRQAEGIAAAATAPEMAREEWITADGPNGPVRAHVVTPKGATSDLTHVYIHGGGFVYGSALQTVGVARRIADQAKLPVASIEYSLSPEHPYPAPIVETCTLYDWLASKGRLGGVIGTSAGGQIALGSMLMQRDKRAAPPRAGVLFYGCYAMTTGSDSYRAHGDHTDGLNRAGMQTYIAAYAVEKASDKRYGDLTVATLEDLPPLWVSCGDDDPLLTDSLVVFGAALARSDKARLHILPGVRHGYVNNWSKDPVADDAVHKAVDWLSKSTA